MSSAPYFQTPYKYHSLPKLLILRRLKRTWIFPYDIVLSPQYRISHSSLILRCAIPVVCFKLYGEVNSVKNTTVNTWLNDGVYYQWKKLHVSAYNRHLQVVITFFLKEFYILCLSLMLRCWDYRHFMCFC